MKKQAKAGQKLIGKAHAPKPTVKRIIEFDNGCTIGIDVGNRMYVDGQLRSMANAVRFLAVQWPINAGWKYGDDSVLTRFFGLIAQRLEPDGVLVGGVPDDELLEMIAGQNKITLMMPLTLPPNHWIDIMMGSRKMRTPIKDVISEAVEKCDELANF